MSTSEGEYSRWSADGRRIFYREPAGRILEASIDVQADALRIGRPVEIFDPQEGRYLQPWGLSGDASRFLLTQNPQTEGEETSAGVNLVKVTFHWFEELNRLLATSQ